MYELSNGEPNIDLRTEAQVASKSQRSRSNPKNFEVEYLENGTR